MNANSAMTMIDWVVVGGLATIAAAVGGWLPLFLARRKDRDTMVKTAELVKTLPVLVDKVDRAAERITIVETRLEEREKREAKDDRALIQEALGEFRSHCESSCPVHQEWRADHITGVRPNPLATGPQTEGA